jgi:hypothetical protein
MENQKVSLNSNCKLLLVIFLYAILGIAACSSTPKTNLVTKSLIQEAYENTKPMLLRTSADDSRPIWTKKTVFEEQGKLYFSGGFLNGSDYSVTIRCANAEALKVTIQGISQFIRAEFSSYVHGTNSDTQGIERYVEDGIATFTKCLHIQGMKQKEMYWEEVLAPSVMLPVYNVWVMLEMGKGDYLKAKADVIRNLREEFDKKGQLEAKEKAEKLLDELKEEVERRISDT